MEKKNLWPVSSVIKVAFCCLSVLSFVSCEMLGTGSGEDVSAVEGQLRISFAASPEETVRSSVNIPDTSDFLLTVRSSSGEVVYDGVYGDSPEAIMVKAGSYDVTVISEEFPKPAFSKPQFGDEQCVVVPSGGVADVKLICRQINSGVRLDIDSGFLSSCPDGVLFLKSDKGKLMYGYSEKRIAYFHPGNVSLVMSRGGTDRTLMTRMLESQQILTLKVSVAPGFSDASTSESISVSVDTSRVWISDNYIIGGESGKGDAPENTMTVNQAMSSIGEEDVWVSGYIVGGDLTSSSARFEGPFSSRTCILLGPRSSVSDRSSCISVQLPAGDVRDALNLVDNPGLLGVKVAVKGDVVASYYGLTGLKNCSAYKL